MKPKKTTAFRLDRIKRYMGEGTTNRDLATRLDVTEATLWNLYSNRTKPRAQTVKAMVRLETELGIDAEVV